MPDTPSPEAKSLAYAEGLGLNSVYDEALVARKQLESKVNEIHEARSRKRTLENYRHDREMAILEEERGANSDMPIAALERHLKVVYSNDAELREIRDELLALQGDIDLWEYEMSLLESDIKIAVARLHELGGYFQFMAVIKSTSEARKAREAREADKDPWRT